MTFTGKMAAAAVVGVCLLGSAAWAAAPIDGMDGAERAVAPSVRVPVPADYKLDTEMVVRNWILCISEGVAEDLVRAREASAATAVRIFDEFRTAKTCGQFAELRVILQKPLYAAATDSGENAGAFGALVNFQGGWANAFVVYGGIPER